MRGRSLRPVVGALHVTTLCAFALSQPLFDVLRREPEFFEVHRAGPLDLVILALAVVVGIPMALASIKWAIESLVPRAVPSLHLLSIAALVAMVALPATKRLVETPGAIPVAVALVVGVVAAVAYSRFEVARSFATALSLAVPIFVVVFLATPSIARQLRPKAVAPAVSANVTGDAPVVVLVFDGLSLAALLDRNGEIDAGRYPNFAELAETSHWFRNATTTGDSTILAIPSLLTGRYPDGTLIEATERPPSLYTALSPPYRRELWQAWPALCPDEICNGGQEASRLARLRQIGSDLRYVYLHLLLPVDWAGSLPPVDTTLRDFGGGADEVVSRAYGGRRDVAAKFQRFLRGIVVSPERTLHYLHLNLPHLPYNYMASGRRHSLEQRSLRIPGTGSRKQGWQLRPRSPFKTAQLLQLYLLQAEYSDLLVGALLQRLEENDLRDRSLLVVTADHGVNFLPGRPVRDPSPEGLAELAHVPLFIKLPGQREGARDDRNVELIDVFPTIVDALGGALPAVDGRSLIDPVAGERPQKRLYRNPRRFPKLAGAPIEAGRTIPGLQETVERNFETLELESGPDGVFVMGEYRSLLGRKVAELDVRADTALNVRIENRLWYDEVDPRSEFVPAMVQGRLLAGTGPVNRAQVAIAVNGTVQAVVPSDAIKARAGRFEAILPESAFRAGRNEIEIYAVENGVDGPVLRTVARR